MKFQVNNWRDVFVYSALITALAVAVPLTVVSIALWPFAFFIKLPILAISGAIPFFITIPISIFAMHMFKLVNQTVATLDELIKFDAMTGLLSRTNFLHSVAEARQKGGAFVLLDADHFKKINDAHGHEAGDNALKFLSNAMMQVVGAHGFVGRLGGEEFAIYLPQANSAQASLLMRLCCAVQIDYYMSQNLMVAIASKLKKRLTTRQLLRPDRVHQETA